MNRIGLENLTVSVECCQYERHEMQDLLLLRNYLKKPQPFLYSTPTVLRCICAAVTNLRTDTVFVDQVFGCFEFK